MFKTLTSKKTRTYVAVRNGKIIDVAFGDFKIKELMSHKCDIYVTNLLFPKAGDDWVGDGILVFRHID